MCILLANQAWVEDKKNLMTMLRRKDDEMEVLRQELNEAKKRPTAITTTVSTDCYHFEVLCRQNPNSHMLSPLATRFERNSNKSWRI